MQHKNYLILKLEKDGNDIGGRAYDTEIINYVFRINPSENILFAINTVIKVVQDTENFHDIFFAGEMDESYGLYSFGWAKKYYSWSVGFEGRNDNILIPFEDGLVILYNYFKAYKTFVEEYLQDEYKNQITSTTWYKDFLKELSKLEAIYKDLVAKGEIEEVEEL